MVSMWLHLPPNTPSNVLSVLPGQGDRLCLRNMSAQSIFTVSVGRKFCECYLFSMRHTMIATPILEGGTLISVLFLSQLPIRSLNLESTLTPIDRSAFPGVPFSLDHMTLRYTLWNQSILSRILTTYRTTVLLGPFGSTINQSKALRSHSGLRMGFSEVSYNFPEVL